MPSTNERFVALRRLKHGPSYYLPGDLLPEDFGKVAHINLEALLSAGEIARAVTPTESASNPAEDATGADAGEGAGSSSSEDNESNSTPDDGDDSTNEDDAEESDPKVTPSGFNPSEHNAEEVVAYVEENPDDREAVIAAEEAGKARKTVLAQLRVDPSQD